MEDQQKLVDSSDACRARDRELRWKAICPAEFQNTDPLRLPDPRASGRVMSWNYSAFGLLLNGDSGAGKSRSIWKLCEREFKNGRSLRVLHSGSGLDYARLYDEGPSVVSRWVSGAAESDLLLMDDTFKVKLTESFECALFTIINLRTEHQRPILFTSNDTGDTLIARMSTDRGVPMVRRIRDFTKTITFQS
jgi:DNA replication protein DnaC